MTASTDADRGHTVIATSTAAPGPTGRRAVAVRHELGGTLVTRTALRVGGWTGTPDADLVVARDGLERALIPGTSLAGALRAWLGGLAADDGGALFDGPALDRVFGSLELYGHGGQVCRIRVDDAVALGDVDVLIRDGVGIDRGTASAAAGYLYQHEVVPAGTRFAVRIVAERTADDAERVADAIRLLTAGLVSGRVEVGAARTRGLGGVVLTDARTMRVDLGDRDQVIAWLSGLAPVSPVDPAEVELPHDGKVDIEIRWAATTPVMVKASTVSEPPDATSPHAGGAEADGEQLAVDERVVDTVPLRTTDGLLLLPGSSLKGVLRSHAERVERTVRGIEDLPERWLDQVNDPRLVVSATLFGTAGDSTSTGTDSNENTSGGTDAVVRRRGSLSVHDCHGDVRAERITTHVAVDRWTGGAAENLLFSVQEPTDVGWEPIRLSLDVRRLERTGTAAAALALLLLTLRDLADGWVGLGFGVTRGHGGVSVTQTRFTVTHPGELWQRLHGRTLDEVIADPGPEVAEAFEAWRAAVRS